VRAGFTFYSSFLVLLTIRRVNNVKHGTTAKTVGWPCVLQLVSNVTIWQPTSRGVKGNRGSTSGSEVSKCKILVVRKCTMGLIFKTTS
jgi:hypothetical protein